MCLGFTGEGITGRRLIQVGRWESVLVMVRGCGADRIGWGWCGE